MLLCDRVLYIISMVLYIKDAQNFPNCQTVVLLRQTVSTFFFVDPCFGLFLLYNINVASLFLSLMCSAQRCFWSAR